jgi:hypothetical protein
MTPSRSNRLICLFSSVMARPWLMACLLGLLTLIVFLPTIACDFVNWDDNAYVYRNPVVLEGITTRGVTAAFTRVMFHNWAPLTILSYQADASLYGARPAGYHLTNVLLHAVAVGLFAVALGRMTGAPGRSAAAVLLFAIHPLRVESVAWVAERKDVLSVLFLAVALLAYERYCRRPCGWRYAAVCTAMLASLLAKATLVTLPALLLLVDVWPMGRLRVPGGPRVTTAAAARYPACSWQWVLVEKLPLLALSALFIAITLLTQERATQVSTTLPLLTNRVPNSVHAIACYLVDTVLPVRMHPAHIHPGPAGWPPMSIGLSLALLAAVGACAWLAARREPAVAWGLLWFLIALSPTLGIVVQQGFQARADRFTYVPHIGLMIAIVWGAAAAADRLRVPQWTWAIVLLAAAVGCVAADRRQIAVWKDSETLWSHVLTIDPDNPIAYNNLGTAFYERGLVRESVPFFERSLAIRDTERAHTWLGLALADQGRLEEAIGHYRASLALDPQSVEAHTNLGAALAQLGRIDEALPHFEAAYRLDPDDPSAHRNLARARATLPPPSSH